MHKAWAAKASCSKHLWAAIKLNPGIPGGSLINEVLGEVPWCLLVSIITEFPAPFSVSPAFSPIIPFAVGRPLEALFIAFHVAH